MASHAGHSHGPAPVDSHGDAEASCNGVPDHSDELMGLRIASIFVILIGSSLGALFPILARRASWLKVPRSVFE
jgi:solute carrier family 39 (zinc transporter), member 1/2/3